MKKRFQKSLLASVFLLYVTGALAGGFPIRPRSTVISASINYFFANKGWDTLSRVKPFANEGKFASTTFALNAEYGISRRFTLVGMLPYTFNSYRDTTGYSQTNQGPADLEIGLRYYAANINYTYYFSIQGTYIVPLYNGLSLGYQAQGAELKLIFAGTGTMLNRNYSFAVENGVRQYFGGAGPIQDRYSGTFSLTLDRKYKHQVSASLGGFYSASSLGTAFNAKQVGSNRDFAFNQASLSYGFAATKKITFFVSAGKFISGRNTGRGSSASVTLIVRP